MTVLANVSIFPASRAQIFESRRRSYTEWGRGLTLKEYVERDEVTELAEVGRDGKLTTWVLAPREGSHTIDFMCSCETFRREGIIARRSQDLLKSWISEEVTCYAIASVFTPTKHRGRGYARHMMRLLHWVLAPEPSLTREFPPSWGPPPGRLENFGNATFSALYSDVGHEFYSVCGLLTEPEGGWLVAEHFSTTWGFGDISKLLSRDPTNLDLQWGWLDNKALEEAWKLDGGMLKRDLTDCDSSSQAVLSFLPGAGVAEFQYQRMQFFIEKMTPRPICFGVCLLANTSALQLSNQPLSSPTSPYRGDLRADNSFIFASWTIEIRPHHPTVLIVTRMRCSRLLFDSLLRVITDYCAKYGIENIEIWNIPRDLKGIAQSLGGKTFQRDEHLPSFKCYGYEDMNAIGWLNNEKFCWC